VTTGDVWGLEFIKPKPCTLHPNLDEVTRCQFLPEPLSVLHYLLMHTWRERSGGRGEEEG
jgi:hypothetical protein